MLKGMRGGEMVTARLLTDCSDTLRNIHTNARENITRTLAKRKAGFFFMAHSVLFCVINYIIITTRFDLCIPYSCYSKHQVIFVS